MAQPAADAPPPAADAATAASRESGACGDVPLCVDLDGTLLRTDLLAEALVALARRHPLRLFLVPCWLLRGRAFLKRRLAQCVELDVSRLPVNAQLLAYLGEQRRRERRVLLVTASDQALADAVAAHVGVFDEVLGSDGRENLKGRRKAERLVARFGAAGFAYAGNGRADLPVFAHAKAAIVVGGAVPMRRWPGTALERAFPAPVAPWRALGRALRSHQWVKNLLLFVPLIGAHRFADAGAWLAALEGFAAWCLLGYVGLSVIAWGPAWWPS